MNGSEAPTKVAVLGGGVGGMTAAFELTATPELQKRFDVTVYQLGWRVGGKGASGRNAAHGQRIEEHGLHVWFGFYDNGFRLMRDAYEELGRAPGQPLATFDEAFKPCDELILYDRQGDGWHPFVFNPPPNFLRPGEPGELPTFWEMAATACRWALGRWREVRDERPGLAAAHEPDERFSPPWLADLVAEVADDLLDLPLRGAEHLLELAERLASTRARHTDHLKVTEAGHAFLLGQLLGGFRTWLWELVEGRVEDDPDLRLFFTMVDTAAATVKGIVEDRILDRGFGAVDDQEWCAWLVKHGAHQITVGATPAERSPVLRAVYDVAFGYPGGVIDDANVAAGTATNDLLRLLFGYRGSLMYKMQAGMGDVVFTPLYRVLEKRGVKFKFFHAVTGLHLARDAKRVDSVEVVPQVELTGSSYDPFVDVKGLDCWPSKPLWEQLKDGTRLEATGVDFEAEANPLEREPITLERGRDFDQVVLGIPVGALEPICGELMARDERFRRAVDTAVTVQTQAFQVWATKPSAELGWRHRTNSVAGCYVEPLDTWCDMSHLIEREAWKPADGVKAIGYVCGVLPEVEPAVAADTVRRNAVSFLEGDVGTLWPGFGWNALAGAGAAKGGERFASQYWRANVALTERYVLTPSGTVEHRLPSDDSGFENLVLAGDWTKNGIDGGCVEAAVTSGIQAAAKLTGRPQRQPGTDPRWLRPNTESLPAYVEYGGRATAPPDFHSVGGNLLGLLLRGDERKIRSLVERVYSEPAGHGIEYRSVGSRVLLLMGGFERVSSTTPPFDRWGSVSEILAAFWVPVLGGRRVGDLFLAERLCLAVPYIFVDNPMSYLGGRETYGYAKTMGQFTPPSGVAEHVTMHTFGGNFGTDQGAAWRPFLQIDARGPRLAEVGPGAEEELIEEPGDIVRYLAGELPELGGGHEIMLADVKLAADLVEDMLAWRVRQLFLKQFRDATDGTRACYRSVVEAPVDVERFQIRPSALDWDLEIFPLDSHPIGQELGVGSQRAERAFHAELDMIVQEGTEIGRVARETREGVASLAPSGHPNGAGGVVEQAARWLLHVPGTLERISRELLRRF